MKNLDISNVSVSPRIQGLIDELFKGKPQVEWERAALVTESYKATENLPTV